MKKMSRQDKLIPTREQAYFQISENLYGENEVIKVTFNNNGAHHGKTYVYDHDDLYDKTIHHLMTLPVWQSKSIYTSINNIPRVAMKTGLVKKIK
tara:strand:+ start:22 stop:306 length:285 start_codon:yes stop_codon:yes gene_type:complete